MESILTSIKKLLNIPEEDDHFDMDVIIHINSAFSRLNGLGVGPKECFSIHDGIPIWSDFIQDNKKINDVKTYVYLKVKVVFDPPLSSSVLSSMENLIKELEWELNVTSESASSDVEENEYV